MGKFPKIAGAVLLVAVGGILGVLFVITITEKDAQSEVSRGGESHQEIEVSPPREYNDSLAVKLANIDAGGDAPATVIDEYHRLLVDVREQFSRNTDSQIDDAIQTVFGLRKYRKQWTCRDSLDLIHRQIPEKELVGSVQKETRKVKISDQSGLQFMVERGNIAEVAEQIFRYRQAMDARTRARAIYNQQTERIPTH